MHHPGGRETVTKIRLLAALAAAAGLAACQTTGSDGGSDSAPEIQAAPLSAAEVQIYLAESTLIQTQDDSISRIYLAKDTTMRGLAKGKGGATERAQGFWAVTPEGQLCLEWGTAWSGQAGCVTVYQFGDKFVLLPPGAELDDEDLRVSREAGDQVAGGG